MGNNNFKIEMKKKKDAKHFLAGGLSGIVAASLGQPFDILRTKMIGQKKNNLKAMQIFKDIVKREGVRGLYRGTAPTILRVFPGASIYFGCIHVARDIIKTDPQWSRYKENKLLNFGIGAASRSVAATITNPLFVVKSRFEYASIEEGGESLRGRSVWGTLKQIHGESGFRRGLMRGLVPTLARDVPYAGFFYLLYRQMMDALEKRFDYDQDADATKYQLYMVFPSAAVASCTATFLTHPADVIRTRWHLRSKMVEGSLKSYWRGISPRLVKRTLSSALSWVLYEKISQMLGVVM